ncbi:MAG: ligase ATP-dependent (dnl1) [Acidobacteriaceae bacterium]|nr:ligase ATP-dependent (dnl1) [Acidobacteriaceae bacterium]
MRTFAETADRIAATTKKLEKTALLAKYLKSAPIEEAAVAAVFFSGRAFPMWEETTLQVGGTLLWRIVEELSGRSDLELTAAYREHGDLGAVAGAVLPGGTETQSAPSKIRLIFREIAAVRGPAAKAVLVRKLLSQVSPLEAKYIVKIMTGDLRIGLKEGLVEEAIAKAFGGRVKDVQRANMLLGDIGETLRLAAEGRLAEARMRLFHPIGFMLASPAESAEDALSYFQNAWVEDKYDGIRAQAHCSGETVRFFSRTRDEITESFPELPDALAGLPQDVILDGEIVAWSYLDDETPTDDGDAKTENVERRVPAMSGVEGPSPVLLKEETGRALPFSALQQRLGRKKVSEQLMREVPVAYLVFDVLYAGGELVMDRPLRERARILDELLKTRTINHEGREGTRRKTKANPAITQSNLAFDPECLPPTQIIRAPVFQASSPEALNKLFDDAQARGNEGLMIKDPESPYTPGRRGKSWLKLKRELATLDVVVTAVEYGHGKRIGVLSDYTFAVRDGDRLLNIGKAYSGLTDIEIAEMTKWFLDHTIEDQGFRRTVEPKVVLEVAFNNIMKSDRHSSGYALRFPRIVRLRPDKLPEEADTTQRVEDIFQKQGG